MCKYILIGLIVALVVLMIVSAVVVQEYGWIGFLILLGALVALTLFARWAIPSLLRYLIRRPMLKLGTAVRGARIVVHSVTPCDRPPPDEYSTDDDEHDDAEATSSELAIEQFDADGEDYRNETTIPLSWYRIEFSVIPADAESSAGRIAHRRAWTPSLIGAIGPRPNLRRANPFGGWAPSDEFDHTHVQNSPAELLDGENLISNPHQVFGEGRLQMRVGVAPSVMAVTITYAHFTELGVVPIPRIDIRPDAAT